MPSKARTRAVDGRVGRGGALLEVLLVPTRIGERGRAQRNPSPQILRAPEGWSKGRKLFALRMVGDSMNGAGILAGDTLVVRVSEARDGDVVLAAVGDELTVKRLRRRQRQLVLEPENPAFASRTFAPRAVRIIGVLAGLVRA